MKARLFTLIRIIVSLSLIMLILWLLRDKLPAIIATIRGSDPFMLGVGFIFFIAAVFFVGIRLAGILSVQGIDIGIKDAIYLTFIGYFFNNFMPTSIGGDLAKAYYAGKRSNKKAAAFAAVFMDRFFAMIPFTLLPVITLLFFGGSIENAPLRVVIYALFLCSLVMMWLLLHKDTARYLAFIIEPFKSSLWYSKLQKGYGFLNQYSRHRYILVRSFILSVLAQSSSIVACYFFARAIGVVGVGLNIYFIVVPVVSVMTMLPSLNGLGIREGGFVYMLKSYMLTEQAFAVSILFLVSLTLVSVLGGIIYAFKKSKFSFKVEEAQ